MSRSIISHDQFASLDGGSRRLSDMSEGPKSGYYVSRDPGVRVEHGGSFEDRVKDADPREVEAHFNLVNEAGARTARPEQSPDEVYQGTWSHNGSRYLDVSDRYTASTAGLMHALQHGMANTQLAAWAAHNPVHGEEFGPGDKREVSITRTDSDGTKTGFAPGVRYVANALHAKEAQRARQRGR